jgi:hypothetical protein
MVTVFPAGKYDGFAAMVSRIYHAGDRGHSQEDAAGLATGQAGSQ